MNFFKAALFNKVVKDWGVITCAQRNSILNNVSFHTSRRKYKYMIKVLKVNCSIVCKAELMTCPSNNTSIIELENSQINFVINLQSLNYKWRETSLVD